MPGDEFVMQSGNARGQFSALMSRVYRSQTYNGIVLRLGSAGSRDMLLWKPKSRRTEAARSELQGSSNNSVYDVTT